MGLPINVYRTGRHDLTIGGVSGTHDRLVVVNIDGPFKPTADAPAVMLIPHPAGPYFGQILVPAQPGDGTDEWEPVRNPAASQMFGGNYGCSGDARWGAATAFTDDRIGGGPIAIHDRFER